MDILEAIKGILPNQWTGWHEIDGERVAQVTVIKPAQIGLNGTTEWMKFVCKEGDDEQRLMGKMRVWEAGQRGGADQIEVDGIQVEEDDCVYGLQSKFGFPPKFLLAVAYKYKDAAGHHRYEFHGPIRVPLAGLFG